MQLRISNLKYYLLMCWLIFPSAFAGLKVVYPNIDGIGAESIGYSVLKLALEKSGQAHELSVYGPTVNQQRARDLVEQGQLSLFDTGFQEGLDQRFDPIYLPIDRGILGWRLFIIHKDNQEKFANIKSLKDLQQYIAGQGKGWGDIVVIENAGIKVKTAGKIPSLIKMVGGKRFDFFPLGANEVYSFLDKFGGNDPNLVIDTNVVLVYPYGRFFYVKKDDKSLAEAIRSGMEKALADGSLQKMLESHKYFKDAFSTAKLKERVRIDIDTPNLSDGFKSIDEKWWFNP
ncbi:transporter substrate-binding domain-containing protein [Endozoicomonas sp. SM1973]|uniref:Transporter substrate-binding domain-containing protein n=1 Tax=Spartinivicinus marinus TaxID=2994442 RepID=A0A853I4D1_9GAMM|nr:transporter substrate-binding domain-containing protein [Spartinivicinus marinus]MCX4029935.1 transporter substrate-binding domain-containing protein [Spartinivicinus marinus]NYZ64821.1 transporter substrate-binding domain-containing protein [Spartinivicinus marinus]